MYSNLFRIIYKAFVATKSILLGFVFEKRAFDHWCCSCPRYDDKLPLYVSARHWSFGSRGFWRFFQRDFAPRVLRRLSPVRDGCLLRGAGNQDHKMCFKIRFSITEKSMAPTCFLLDGLLSKWKYYSHCHKLLFFWLKRKVDVKFQSQCKY